MRIPLVLSLAALAAVPTTADAALKKCGKTPSKTYDVSVSGASCAFAMATYRATIAYDNKHHFVSGVSRNYSITVQGKPMDCRANARAHGQFDFACNDLNRYGQRIVRLDNATLP